MRIRVTRERHNKMFNLETNETILKEKKILMNRIKSIAANG